MCFMFVQLEHVDSVQLPAESESASALAELPRQVAPPLSPDAPPRNATLWRSRPVARGPLLREWRPLPPITIATSRRSSSLGGAGAGGTGDLDAFEFDAAAEPRAGAERSGRAGVRSSGRHALALRCDLFSRSSLHFLHLCLRFIPLVPLSLCCLCVCVYSRGICSRSTVRSVGHLT